MTRLVKRSTPHRWIKAHGEGRIFQEYFHGQRILLLNHAGWIKVNPCIFPSKNPDGTDDYKGDENERKLPDSLRIRWVPPWRCFLSTLMSPQKSLRSLMSSGEVPRRSAARRWLQRRRPLVPLVTSRAACGRFSFFSYFFIWLGLLLLLFVFRCFFFALISFFCLYASLLRPTLRVWSWIVFYHHFSGLGGRFFGLKSKTKIMEMSRNQFNGTRSQPSIGNATFGTSVGRGNFVVKVRPGEISWPIGMMSLSLIYQSLRIVSARSTSQRRRRLTTVQWASGRLTTTTTTTIEVVAAAFGCLIGVPVYEC